MSKAPAFQFYAAEYLADMNVQLLTVEQEGIYIRLLAFCWREGSLPNDDCKLASLCKGCSHEALAAVKILFEVSGDGSKLLHKRLDYERKKQEEWKKKCSKGGRKSSTVRKQMKEEKLQVNKEVRVVELQRQVNGNISFASSSSSSPAKQVQAPLASTAVAVPADGLVCTLPLNQGYHEVFEADVQLWQALYPAVDVRQELRSIKGWALASPQRRKTRGGIARLINSWLSRAQNEARPSGGGNGNRNHGKTGGNFDAAAQAIAFLEARDNQAPDEVCGAPTSTGESFNPTDIRGRLINLSVGRH